MVEDEILSDYTNHVQNLIFVYYKLIAWIRYSGSLKSFELQVPTPSGSGE